MDFTGLFVHAEQPAVITGSAVVLPALGTPFILPVACLPPELRLKWFLRRDDVPLAQRISAAIDGGHSEAAWPLLIAQADGVLVAPPIANPVLRWSAAELRLLDPTANPNLPMLRRRSEALAGAVSGSAGEALAEAFVAGREEDHLALKDVQTVLGSLPWPRWLGPVLCVPRDDRLFAGVPTAQAAIVRPALPVLAVDIVSPRDLRRSVVAAGLAHLALDLTAPPPEGWPAWIHAGAAGVCAAVARGEGPSPRLMWQRRQAAGASEIARLFISAHPDHELSTAVCAYLLHSSRRGRFAAFLDPLRHGASSETALLIAYGVSVQDIISQR